MKRLVICALALAAVPLVIAAAPDHEQLTPATRSVEPWTNPTPHTYRVGDQLSGAFGSVSEVPDWSSHRLASPPEGHRWVKYGDKYLLVQRHTAIVSVIVSGSLLEGRA